MEANIQKFHLSKETPFQTIPAHLSQYLIISKDARHQIKTLFGTKAKYILHDLIYVDGAARIRVLIFPLNGAHKPNEHSLIWKSLPLQIAAAALSPIQLQNQHTANSS